MSTSVCARHLDLQPTRARAGSPPGGTGCAGVRTPLRPLRTRRRRRPTPRRHSRAASGCGWPRDAVHVRLGDGVGRWLTLAVHEQDPLAVEDRAPVLGRPYPAPEGFDVGDVGGQGGGEPSGRSRTEGSAAGGEAHSAVRSSRDRSPLPKGSDHGFHAKGGEELTVLVVHAALGVGHPVAGKGGEVPVEHPPVGPDLPVQREVDGVDAHGERAVGLVLPDAVVRPQGGGDGDVPGELGQEPGMDRRVLGHLAEAHPAVDEGGSERRVRVVGVGAVHDPEVASGDAHVVGRAVVGARYVGGVGGMAARRWERCVSRSSVPAAQQRPPWRTCADSAGERPAGAELGQLEVAGAGRRRSRAGTTCVRRRPGDPARDAWRPRSTGPTSGCLRRRAVGRRSRATPSQGRSPVGRRSSMSMRWAASPQVGNCFDRGVPLVLSGHGVDDLDADALRVERPVIAAARPRPRASDDRWAATAVSSPSRDRSMSACGK